MAEILEHAVVATIIGMPVVLLALAVRHLIPLMRGWRGPWWAGALGPFAFADRFIAETTRSHRSRFFAYTLAFVCYCLVLLIAFGRTK